MIPTSSLRERLFTPVDEVAEVQPLLQRKLGRCLLRVQNYENLLKSIVPLIDISGPAANLTQIHADRVAAMSTRSLGQLVEILKTKYFMSEEDIAEEERQSDKHAHAYRGQDAWVKYRRIGQLDKETQIKRHQDLDAFVHLRNSFVHHFMEKFSVGTVSGCEAAIAFLDRTYEEIDSQIDQLLNWREAIMRTAEIHASIDVESMEEQLKQWAEDPWPNRFVIVDCFRKAELKLAVDGWVFLDDAISFVKAFNPLQTLDLNQRKSWKSVLKATQEFEIETRKNEITGRSKTFYRSKA